MFLVEVTVGPNAGTVIASTAINDPGPQPIAFQLAYPFAAVNADSQYQVFAGIVDGDLGLGDADRYARPGPAGRGQRASTSSSSTGPDLLKGAVTGSITGTDLGPITRPGGLRDVDPHRHQHGRHGRLPDDLADRRPADPVLRPVRHQHDRPDRDLRRARLRVGRDDAVEHADRHRGDHQGQPEVRRGPDGRAGRDDGDARPTTRAATGSCCSSLAGDRRRGVPVVAVAPGAARGAGRSAAAARTRQPAAAAGGRA